MRAILIGLVLASLVAGCAGNQPSIKVIGLGQASNAEDSDAMVVLVEVMNPSQTEMVLSRLKYTIECDAWSPLEGTMVLSRSVRPGSSEVLQIPIRPRAHRRASKSVENVPYVFSGQLFSVDQRLERSWRVSARGRFGWRTSAAAPALGRIVAKR